MKTELESAESYEDEETSHFCIFLHRIEKSLIIIFAVPSFYKLLLGVELVSLLVDRVCTDP